MNLILILFGVLFILIWALLSCRYSVRTRKQWKSYIHILDDIPGEIDFNISEIWTEDGYRLQIFHLRDALYHEPSLNPIIMHHSLHGSAENWLLQGKNKSPAVILARQG